MSSAMSERTSFVLMIGTSAATQGGVATVVRELMASALMDRFSIRYVSTHADGGRLRKLTTAMQGVVAAWWTILVHRPRLVHVHLASRASFWRKMLCLAPAYATGVPVLLHLHGA